MEGNLRVKQKGEFKGMREILENALKSGVEQVVAWADVLDRINVFPVPDGDTGRNLVISLSPLKHGGLNLEERTQALLMSARGNSGNIAARFFKGLLTFTGLDTLSAAGAQGRDMAYGAVKDPKQGTMLSLFDSLVRALDLHPPKASAEWTDPVIRELTETVKATTSQLPELAAAGVVDAGALGMLVFFDAFLCTLAGKTPGFSSLSGEMKEAFDLSDEWKSRSDVGYCMDVVLEVDRGARSDLDLTAVLGREDSVVAISDGDYLKVHLHSENQEATRRRLETVGHVVHWSADDLEEQTRRFASSSRTHAIHIMTDGAGSITRRQAADLGITLLDSYINIGNTSLPETFLEPQALFESMKKGTKVSTAQASLFERQQCYQKVMGLYDKVLYICVGSFYTGNFQAAVDWRAEQDDADRLVVLDSGIASGRLGLAVLATAAFALTGKDPEEVIRFAQDAVNRCEEVLFLDRLQYLAAGGRMSKTGAFFGDMLHVKPVVTPTPEGAKKVGVVRTRKDQVTMAFNRLEKALSPDREASIMLEYTDNREWIEQEILPEVESRFPMAGTILQPLSLTSAAHMGPGTWGLACLPFPIKTE
ncbi:MAG: DegV family EDD domain-containing protein [Deltaproteobacteria bacterium]|nr:DegV family EDD domain-containing protein [Deltaproteobacteria bacterium]